MEEKKLEEMNSEELIDYELQKSLLRFDDAYDDDERKQAISNVEKLHKMKMEQDQAKLKAIEAERKASLDERKYEDERKEAARKTEQEQKVDWWEIGKFSLEVASVVLPLTFGMIGLRRGLKFEETGVFKSTAFREFRGNIFKLFR